MTHTHLACSTLEGSLGRETQQTNKTKSSVLIKYWYSFTYSCCKYSFYLHIENDYTCSLEYLSLLS